MASKDSNFTNNICNSNNVGAEPSTSTSTITKSMKNESGILPSTTRLTSFRIPRDLTLGGNVKVEKSKKVYVPNLNVQRKKKEDTEIVKNDNKPTIKDRKHVKKYNDKGKGHGKQNNLIQSTGVFSEGLSESEKRRYTSRGGSRESNDYRDSKPFLERPKLNAIPEINKAEEDKKLKLLLRDDFIDDGNEMKLDNAPVILPMVDEVKLYTEEMQLKLAGQSEDDQDVKPTILENGEVIIKKDKKPFPHIKKESKFSQSISEILETRPSNNYVLMQFPDCLPGLRPDNDTESSLKTDEQNKIENNSKDNYCTLGDLKEGFLGKLQIFRSGKARLILGANQLDVDVASNRSFRQDLVAAKINDSRQGGELINLGSVNSGLICLPDWESMLANL